MSVCRSNNSQDYGWDDNIQEALEGMDRADNQKSQQHDLAVGPHVIEVVGVYPYKSKNSGNTCLRWVCRITSSPDITITRYSPLLEHTRDMLRQDFAAFDIHLDNFSDDVRRACQEVVGRRALGHVVKNLQGTIIDGFQKI